MICMNEQIEKFLNCKEYLRYNFDVLKEAFIDYYGEEKRQEIEDKFSKALLIAYRAPAATEHFLKAIEKYVSDEIISEVLKKVPSKWEKNDLFENHTIKAANICPIYFFRKFYNQYKIGEEGRIQSFMEEGFSWIQKIIPNFTKEEYDEIVKTQELPEKYRNLPNGIKNNIFYYTDMENSKKEYERAYKNSIDILQKIDSNVTIENVSEIMQGEDVKELLIYAELLPEMILEFESKMEKYKQYENELNQCDQMHDEISKKYYIKLIEENIDLLSPKDIEEFEKYKNNPKYSYVLTPYTNFVFGFSLTRNNNIEAFSKESEQIISNPNEPDWKKQSIMGDRIKFFNMNGINLGDDYEAYLQSSEAKKIWPSFERIEKFVESNNRILNEYNNEYYTSIPSYKEIRQEIDSYNLLDKNDSFNAALFTSSSGRTFINPNVVKTPNGYDLFSLVVVCCNNDDGILDHSIIHELNHLFEATLLGVDGTNYRVVSGWDYCEGVLNQQTTSQVDTLNKNTEKRSYELFNEIINELIAQEIHEKMYEKGQYIFDGKDNTKIRNTTSYEHTFFLVNDFFQEFKKEILESRSNGNIEIIWNKVGKDNFDELNELFSIFNEHFSGFKFLRLAEILNSDVETEETRIFYDLISKRDTILEKMREHSIKQEQDFKAEEIIDGRNR